MIEGMSPPAVPAPSTVVPARESIDAKYTWDLNSIFGSWDAWEAAFAELDRGIDSYKKYEGTLAKGADPLAMMRELFGREGGNCGGKGGSMHIADFKVGMLGANGVVGANILIAVGAAHAVRLRRAKKWWPASSATAPSTAGRSWRG